MLRGKVLSFGEILLRVCPDMSQDWISQGNLPFYIGGAELNVATALALWDIPSSYVSAMPKNAICEEIAQHLQQKGVDMEGMFWKGDRIGIYYLPKGKDVKNAGVVYDRANSSFSELKPSDFDWDLVFNDVCWLHFSAICPAVNAEIAQLCLVAVQEAKARGIFVSLDLNYRSKLWKYGKDPLEIMPEIAAYCDLIMGNIWAAQRMLGTSLQPNFQETKATYPTEELLEQSLQTSKEIRNRFPRCRYVANTFRFDYEQAGIKYFTSLYTEQDGLLVSNEYLSENIVDKVGSGDCFMAGLIYGLYHEHDASYTLEFATVAAYDKLFISSDATVSTVSDIKKRLKK
ncbi:PfkB family carbohydrate kinase [Sphingobacterium sp. LRF_L2]|uniref:PfkB family carbohydrate kinase n=1 Tax=Sphingobacterium sp. LRF_L2 TaxID=3369421 RepID=UPI003F62105C